MPVVQLLLPAVMPRALMTPDFFFLFCFHLLFFCMFWDGLLGESNRIDWGRIRGLSAFTVSLELFFANQCYWRFAKIRALLRGMMGAVYEFAFLTRLFIRPCGKPYDRLACRYVVAATLLFLIDANGDVEASHTEWEHLQQVGLLKREEVRFLSCLAGSQRKLVMLHVASDMAKTGLTEAGQHEAGMAITASLLKYREAQDELQALLEAAMPFAYEHALAVLVIATLALWAYAMAFHVSFFGPLIFACTELLLLGLLELVSEFLHPFRAGSVSLLPSALALLQNVDAVLEYASTLADTGYQADLEEEAKAPTQFGLSLVDVEDFFGIRTMSATSVSVAQPPPPEAVYTPQESDEDDEQDGSSARQLQLQE